MRVRTVLGGVAACAVAVFGGAGAAAAADITIGSTSLPAGMTNNVPCNSTATIYAQATWPAGDTPYAAPYAGLIRGWSVNSTGATAGSSLTLLVLRRAGGTNYTVVGSDTETLATPLPSGGISTFTPAAPIAVRPGDQLGVYVTTDSQLMCLGSDSARLAGYSALAAGNVGAHGVGDTVSLPNQSPDGLKLLVSAQLQPLADAVLGPVTFTPPSVYANGSAVLQTTVGQAGGTAPVPLTFHLPAAGLPVLAAVAGSGACTVTGGQDVSCAAGPVAPGASMPVAVVVGAPTAGRFAFAPSAGVPDPFVDPVGANDGGAATLAVDPVVPATITQVVTVAGPAAPAAPAARCTVPDLRRVPQATARKLLVLLRCKAGATTRAYSSTVAKGLVIRASRKAGSYVSGTPVGLQVSQGRKPKARKKARRRA